MDNCMNTIDSRLLCDHCHGHGYEDTAAGKVACGECNPQQSPQPVAWRVSKPGYATMYLTEDEDWACFCAVHGLIVEALAIIRQ